MGKLQQGAVPRKISKRFLAGFRKLVLAGVPPLTAARTLGIHRSTFYEWLKMLEEAENHDDIHSSLRDLNDIIEQAQAEAISFAIISAKRHIASTTDALKYLAKIAPADFGDLPEQKTDLTVNQIIIGIVQKMNERNALMAAEAGIIDAEIVEGDLEI